MLCVVPLLRALRKAYPSASLALLTSPVNDEIMRGNRYLDETLNFDKREFLTRGEVHPGRLLRFMRMLRDRSFDMVLVPATVSMSFTSDLLAFMTAAPVRLGPATLEGRENPSAFVYTHRMALDWSGDPARHQTLRNLDIARDLGLPSVDLSLEITLTQAEKARGRELVTGLREGRRPVVAMHVGAGKAPNRWPAARFAQLAEDLTRETGAAIIVTAGPMDEEAVRQIELTLGENVYLIQNQPVRYVASVLAEVDLLVSNDTGIMHIGAAVGAPVLSLFGPTSPEQWAPLGKLHRCLKGEGGRIEAITGAEVLATALAMLQERTEEGSPGMRYL